MNGTKPDPMNWTDLDESDAQAKISKEDQKEAQRVDDIFHGAASKPEGKLMIDYLVKRYITDYTVAHPGMDPLEIGIRQGKATLIREILSAIDRAAAPQK